MTAGLVLAADFIERAADPAYGAETNELYGLRWAMLAKERHPAFLGLAELRPEDSGLLSAGAWLWLATSLGEADPELPPEFAESLFETEEDLVFRLRLADAFLHHPALARRYEGENWPLEAQPRGWARDRLLRLIEKSDAVGAIEEMALILMQVANKPALALLRGLYLRRRQQVGELVQQVAQRSGDEPERLRALFGLRDEARE